MIKDVMPSSTSINGAGQVSKASKEEKGKAGDPQEKGLFGLVLQSVQTIKEEFQSKAKAFGDSTDQPTDEEAVSQPENHRNSENTIQVLKEQPAESTENVTKIKLSVSKFAKASVRESETLAEAAKEPIPSSTEVYEPISETEALGSESKIKDIKPLENAPILGSIGVDGQGSKPTQFNGITFGNGKGIPNLDLVQKNEGQAEDQALSVVAIKSNDGPLAGQENMEGTVKRAGDISGDLISGLQGKKEVLVKKGSQKELIPQQQEAKVSDIKEVASKVQQDRVTLFENLMSVNKTEGTLEFNTDLKNAMTDETRDNSYRLHRGSKSKQVITGERLTLITERMEVRTDTTKSFEFSSQLSASQFPDGTDSGVALTEEQELMLKDQMVESVDGKDHKNHDRYNMGYVRLGEMPVTNISVRRNILPGLTQSMMRATSNGKEIPETWQKHSFELEDGNKIQLSTRNVDGVIHVKLASTSIELSKLMQDHGQDIKSHLEQECQLNIDLQFDDQSGQSMENFFENSSSQGQAGASARGGNHQGPGNQKIEKPIQHSVRKFGYNQMEWTV